MTELSELTREVRALRKELRFFCEQLLDHKPVEERPIYPSMAEIVAHVSAALAVPDADIISRAKKFNSGLVRDARLLAVSLCREFGPYTLREIGLHFGGRFEATVRAMIDDAQHFHSEALRAANNVIRAKFARSSVPKVP